MNILRCVYNWIIVFIAHAHITGEITAKTGKIAGYTIEGNVLKGENVGMCGVDGDGYAFWAGSSTGSTAPFRVGHNGSLVATSATITGTIKAGTIIQTNPEDSGTTTYLGGIEVLTYDTGIRLRKTDGTFSIACSHICTPVTSLPVCGLLPWELLEFLFCALS